MNVCMAECMRECVSMSEHVREKLNHPNIYTIIVPDIHTQIHVCTTGHVHCTEILLRVVMPIKLHWNILKALVCNEPELLQIKPEAIKPVSFTINSSIYQQSNHVFF